MNHIPDEEKVYCRFDKVKCNNTIHFNDFPTEFLKPLNVSSMPPHKLKFKVNCVFMSIQNLNTCKTLVNGTRMRVKVCIIIRSIVMY